MAALVKRGWNYFRAIANNSQSHYYQPVDNERQVLETNGREKLVSNASDAGRRNLAWLALAVVLVALIAVLAVFHTPHHSLSEIDLHHEIVSFEPSALYGGKPSIVSDRAWDSLMPDGRGFVLIPDGAAQGLRPGIPTESGIDRYSVSMFHQLHCLGMIRQGYYAALAGKEPHALADDDPRLHGHLKAEAHSQHTEHCLDYLRQAIMCAGDMTIEWAREEPYGQKPFTVDGWGVSHQCKNWEEAVQWTLDHRAPNNHSGIL